MAELTSFGFERENRTDITRRLNNKFRNSFGSNLLITDDSVAGLLIAILAERSLEYEKLLEDLYFSRTLNGAEGIALDDAASYYGFIRKGPQPSSGVAHIEFVDDGTNLSTDIQTSSVFSATNGLTYSPIVGGILNQNVTGYVLDSSTLTANTGYTFAIGNTETGGIVETTLDINADSDAERIVFLVELSDFITENTEGNELVIFIDNLSLYVGYASTTQFVGLAQPIYFDTVDLPSGATFWSGYEVESVEKGFNPLEVGGITGFSPSFSGFQSATSTVEFNPGSENETDAEFRFRIQTASERTPKGTRDALVEAVEDLTNVVSLRLYDNPTLIDRPEADALTFNVVVRGGSNAEIGQTIYDFKPLGRNTSGTESVNVATADNEIETIRFTKAEANPYDIRITYKVNNNTPLSAREQTDVKDSIDFLLENKGIGDNVANNEIASAVLSALTVGRLLSVKIEVKLPEQGSGSYAEGDIAVAFDQYAEANSYTFVRTL